MLSNSINARFLKSTMHQMTSRFSNESDRSCFIKER